MWLPSNVISSMMQCRIDHASAAQHSSKAQDLQRQATPASFSGKAGVPNGKHSSSVNGKLAMSPAHRNTQIRCLCDINIDRGNMVQCEVGSQSFIS